MGLSRWQWAAIERHNIKCRVLSEIGMSDHPRADAVFDLAWDYGHSAGEPEVLNYARDLARLVLGDD